MERPRQVRERLITETELLVLRFDCAEVALTTESPVASIEEATRRSAPGFVVVCDDADREKEGDLNNRAQFVTPEPSTSWRRTRGMILAFCLAPERCDELVCGR